MRVWVAGREDAPDVVRLLIGFRDHMERDWPADATFVASVERLLEDQDNEFLLAASDDEAPAGVCQLRYRYGVWHAAEDCWLEDLFIEDDARRSGLGRALVEASLERARARGCARVALDCNERNEAALALYAAYGFKNKTPGTRDLYLQVNL